MVACILVVINPWHFVQSRWALDCNMLAHVFIIATYFLHIGQTKKVYLYISSAIYAISMYCYGPSIYTVPVFLAIVYLCFLKQKKVTVEETVLSALIYLFISLPYLLCIFINMFKINTIETPLYTIPFFSKTTRATDILFFSKTPFEQLIRNAKCVWNILIMQKDDLIFNSVPNFGISYVLSIPLTLLGLWRIIKNKFNGKVYIQ